MIDERHPIVMQGVEKRYVVPEGETVALAGVDLTVESGEIFGILGPNGSGKTTSIEMLVGLRRPTAGTVRVLGLDPVRDRTAIRANVAIQPQRAAVFERQTVEELLQVWASFYSSAYEVNRIITGLGLQGSRRIRIGKLSGGQQQRVLVGLAMIANPRLLVLDEPSTGLDPNAREELWRMLYAYRSTGGTVLLSTHSMEEAEVACDRVAILHQGRVVACGAPDQLIQAHAPGRQITFTVSARADLSALERYAENTHVTMGTDGRARVRLNVRDSDEVLGLISRDLDARQIEMRDPGLENVFRRLTGKTFTDADGVLRSGKESVDVVEVVA